MLSTTTTTTEPRFTTSLRCPQCGDRSHQSAAVTGRATREAFCFVCGERYAPAEASAPA